MTDTEVLNWLLANITYMEHGDNKDPGFMNEYWPHRDTDCDPIEDVMGMTLRQYVEFRSKK